MDLGGGVRRIRTRSDMPLGLCDWSVPGEDVRTAIHPGCPGGALRRPGW